MRRMALEGVTYRDLAGAAQAKAFLSIAARRDDSSGIVRNFLALVRRAAQREAPP
jgi:hypothetical protein